MKGILFKPDLITAIIEGRKTITRRIIRDNHIVKMQLNQINENSELAKDKIVVVINSEIAPYKIGEIIYVKESWQHTDIINLNRNDDNSGYIFKNSENGRLYELNYENWYWKSPLFMPAEAARLFLQIESVRVERLQDISEEDAKSEGVKATTWEGVSENTRSYRNGFFSKWVEINGSESLNKNPWVWVYTFKVIASPNNKGNIILKLDSIGGSN